MAIDFGEARNSTKWHPEPAYRGTYGLLLSCLITMTLCVWAAVHLNLPEHNKATMQSWRKVWWLLLALFAPELVAWTAFEQYREARAPHRQVKEAVGEEMPRSLLQRFRPSASSTAKAPDPEIPANDLSKQSRRHQWTMTHSHFAAMGGFTFDTDIIGRDLLPDGRKRGALTSLGVLALAQTVPHLLPNISEAQINDKSKANWLAKTIILLQVVWFSVQCISRMAAGLTVSLLELNTFAHAICALLIYGLWWDKPLDVEEPILIEGPDMAIVCAGMFMRSSMGTNCLASDYFPDSHIIARLWFEGDGFIWETETVSAVELGFLETLATKPPGNVPVYAQVDRLFEGLDNDFLDSSTYSTHPREQASTAFTAQAVTPEQQHCLFMGQSLYGFGFRRARYHHFNTPPFRIWSLGRFFTRRHSTLSSVVQNRGFAALQRPFIMLTVSDILRLRLAGDSYQKYPTLLRHPEGRDYKKPYLQHPNQAHQIWLNEYIVARVRNWPFSKNGGDVIEGDAYTILFGLLIAGLAYGGLHLLAWNPPVTTTAEVLMWRISGITVTVFGSIPFIGLAALWVFVSINDYFQKRTFWQKWKTWASGLKGLPKWFAATVTFVISVPVMVSAVLLGFAMVAGGLLYVLSRIYLLVECIISIPHLPDSVFQTLTWSKYFPHFA